MYSAEMAEVMIIIMIMTSLMISSGDREGGGQTEECSQHRHGLQAVPQQQHPGPSHGRGLVQPSEANGILFMLDRKPVTCLDIKDN